ncbi:hypothetical protein [Desulfovibrio sp.]|uniref:hypothetical protein n=1 Tax=Desulfovibrio sp. TaxID=885 RepID=UPI0023C19F35|nr:hypothetical protein [Desulfovibrio sp.]MDE7241171.1 hypothetical protein [Desulfovibrio sp.]
MAVSEKFKNSVVNGDLGNIRLSMGNALILDTTFRDFAEMEKLAADVPGLYVAYDNGPMEKNPAHWNEDYLGLQTVKLQSNFCPERIEHVKEVVRKLHPPKPANTAQASARTDASAGRQGGGSDWSSPSSRRSAPSYEERKRMDARNGNIIKIVGCGAGGVIIGAVVGSAADGAAAGGVIGALVGCAVGYIISKR